MKRELRSPHRHSGEQWPSQSEALEKAAESGWPCGRGSPRSVHLQRGGLPSSLPCPPFFFSFLLLAISLETWSVVFLPEKKCLRARTTKARRLRSSDPCLPLRWLEWPSHPSCFLSRPRPACAHQAGSLGCLLGRSCYLHPQRRRF